MIFDCDLSLAIISVFDLSDIGLGVHSFSPGGLDLFFGAAGLLTLLG